MSTEPTSTADTPTDTTTHAPMEDVEDVEDVESTAFLGRIYRVSAPSFGSQIYVGSTRNTLSFRLMSHKCQLRKWERGKGRYVTSFALVGLADCTIDLIEEAEYQDLQHLRDREAYWIERLPCVNRNVPGRSPAESTRISHATRVPCKVCGKVVRRDAIKEHRFSRSCMLSAFVR